VKHAYFLTSEAAAIVYSGINAKRVFVIAQMANAQCTTKDINENTISIIRRLSKSPRNPKPQNKKHEIHPIKTRYLQPCARSDGGRQS
jgi:hypothetical protein